MVKFEDAENLHCRACGVIERNARQVGEVLADWHWLVLLPSWTDKQL